MIYHKREMFHVGKVSHIAYIFAYWQKSFVVVHSHYSSVHSAYTCNWCKSLLIVTLYVKVSHKAFPVYGITHDNVNNNNSIYGIYKVVIITTV